MGWGGHPRTAAPLCVQGWLAAGAQPIERPIRLLDPPHRLQLELPAEGPALPLEHRLSFSENCPYFFCLTSGVHSTCPNSEFPRELLRPDSPIDLAIRLR